MKIGDKILCHHQIKTLMIFISKLVRCFLDKFVPKFVRKYVFVKEQKYTPSYDRKILYKCSSGGVNYYGQMDDISLVELFYSSVNSIKMVRLFSTKVQTIAKKCWRLQINLLMRVTYVNLMNMVIY